MTAPPEGTRPLPPVPARLVLAGLAVLAVVPFGVLLADHGYLVGALAAVAAVSVVSWVLSPRRPLAVSVLAAAAVVVAGAVVVLALGDPEPGSSLIGSLARLPEGWSALRTPPLPAAPTPAALVLPVAGAAVAAFAALELAVRSRWAALGTVAPTALLIVALLYSGRSTVGAPLLVGAFVAGVLAVGALERVASPRRPTGEASGDRPVRRVGPATLRPVPATLAVLVLLAGLAALIGATSAGDPLRRAEIRVSPEAKETFAERSPLSRAGAAQAAADDPVVFRVAFDRTGAPGAGPVRLRVATLDGYDGEKWSTGTRRFERVGDLLPRRYPAGDDRAVIGQDITLTAAYPGSFLPALPGPVEVGDPARPMLRYDGETGDLLVTAAGHDGLHYRLASAAGAGTVPQSPTDERPDELTALPGPVPRELEAFARNLPGATPGTRLEALATRLRESRSHDPQAAPGHSYPRLLHLLGRADTGGTEQATTVEQPPALFAVVARLLGRPSRVVVGYDVPASGDAGAVAVTAKQVRTWAEVHLEGQGWVAFDLVGRDRPDPATATARVTTSTTSVEAGTGPGAATTLAPRPTPSESEPDGGCPAGEAPCTAAPSWEHRIGQLLGAAGFAFVLCAPLLVVAGKRVRKDRRRRHRSPARRLAGAWQETVAGLRGRGLPVTRGMTAAEIATAGGDVFDDQVAGLLTRWSRVLDTAVFGPAAPDDTLADEAWNTHTRLADALRATSPLHVRLRLAVDLRPLFRRGS